MTQPLPPIDSNPSPADVQFLEDRINEFNVARTGFDDGRLLSIFLRDESGTVSAGIYGWTWGGCCEVRFLWVRADLRGQDIGSRLLAAVEDEAKERGCLQVVLDTHSFQAPEFYKRHGYQVAGVYEDYPIGHQQYFMFKRLR